MESLNDFFYGLDSEASLIFLGLLILAFLIGLLPIGFNYAFKSRDYKKQIEKLRTKYSSLKDEKEDLETSVVNEQMHSDQVNTRIQNLLSDRRTLKKQIEKLEEKLRFANENAEANILDASKHEEYIQSLRGRVAALSSQVQSLKKGQKKAGQPTATDFNVLSSLHASRTKVEALEKLVESLTADNEQLRRERAKLLK